MSENIDIDKLNNWVGNQECTNDVISSELLKRFEATFSGHEKNIFKSNSFFGLHWCLAQPNSDTQDLGEDGHPAKGGFLPPIPLSQRMWASGDLKFYKNLKIDVPVKKISTIKEVSLKKNSASGPLVFVEINHIFEQENNVCIEDNQTLVYRNASKFKHPMPEVLDDEEIPIILVPTSVLLFRYSAITFNGHRIHFDKDFAIKKEGYPGLVVHGPLMATLLMNLAQSSQENKTLTRFKFRAVAPAFVDNSLRISIKDKDSKILEIRNDEGVLIMKAEARYA